MHSGVFRNKTRKYVLYKYENHKFTATCTQKSLRIFVSIYVGPEIL